MIGWLRGTLIGIEDGGRVLVGVGGVGYEVTMAAAVIATLGNPGNEVEIHIHTHVREDAITLYGFRSARQRRTFEILLDVHGVGPSLALAIMGALAPEDLYAIVELGDVDAFCSVPGVGRKTAERLMIELKGCQELLGGAGLFGPAGDPDATQTGQGGGLERAGGAVQVAEGRSQVRSALKQLGYTDEELRGVVGHLAGCDTVEEGLKLALKELSRSR